VPPWLYQLLYRLLSRHGRHHRFTALHRVDCSASAPGGTWSQWSAFGGGGAQTASTTPSGGTPTTTTTTSSFTPRATSGNGRHRRHRHHGHGG
jgi:hypothetical protein